MKYIILLCLVKLLELSSFAPLRICYIANIQMCMLHETLNNKNVIKFPAFYMNNTNAGWDNRYNESEVDQYLLERIRENLEKYETLKYLENDRISILDKLRKLEESGINPLNLNAGGLMKDWDFNV